MDPELLAKFFRKECTEEEVKVVLNWFEQENIDQEDLWKSEWEEAGFNTELPPSASARSTLGEIHNSLPVDLPKEKQLQFSIKIAAIVLIFATSIFAIWYFALDTSKEAENLSFIKETETTEVPPGMKKIFQLKDSSKVYLNSQSRVIYPSEFRQEKREVELIGEAYFEVKKNSNRPFVVKTGDLITTALGTAFNIRSFEGSQSMTVSLTEGKVQIDYKDNPENRLILLPGEQITLDKTSGKIIKGPFDKRKVLAWTKNTIIFDNASLDEIIGKLERWYGVAIKVEYGNPNAGKDWDYSGEFDQESLRNVLDGISFVKGFTYKMEGKHVEIYIK